MRPPQRGQAVGDGTPVHITIPTDNPWVPLRILALGKTAAERVEADVYLLTDQRPALLPAPIGDNGLDARSTARRRPSRCSTTCARTAAWSGSRRRRWLTKVAHRRRGAADLSFDLAIDAPGRARAVAGHGRAGSARGDGRRRRPTRRTSSALLVGLALTIGGIGGILLLIRRRPPLSTA